MTIFPWNESLRKSEDDFWLDQHFDQSECSITIGCSERPMDSANEKKVREFHTRWWILDAVRACWPGKRIEKRIRSLQERAKLTNTVCSNVLEQISYHGMLEYNHSFLTDYFCSRSIRTQPGDILMREMEDRDQCSRSSIIKRFLMASSIHLFFMRRSVHFFYCHQYKVKSEFIFKGEDKLTKAS